MIHLICGRLCSGKSYFAAQLAREKNAVVLSCDELSLGLFPDGLGDKHDEMMKRVQAYLHSKAEEIANAGCDVILEWGFWRRSDREYADEYYARRNIPVRWYYMDTPDNLLRENIDKRNLDVLSGTDKSYYVDEGLFAKMASLFETPREDEMTGRWTVIRREK